MRAGHGEYGGKAEMHKRRLVTILIILGGLGALVTLLCYFVPSVCPFPRLLKPFCHVEESQPIDVRVADWSHPETPETAEVTDKGLVLRQGKDGSNCVEFQVDYKYAWEWLEDIETGKGQQIVYRVEDPPKDIIRVTAWVRYEALDGPTVINVSFEGWCYQNEHWFTARGEAVTAWSEWEKIELNSWCSPLSVNEIYFEPVDKGSGIHYIDNLCFWPDGSSSD